MIQVKKMKRATLLGLVPVFALVALAGFAFISCDTGSAPDPATGPISNYDPLFDDPQPGISARVRPNTVSVPNASTGDRSSQTVMVGYYRNPQGEAVSGLQMNFKADPSSPNISFNPPASFTDGNGGASTEVTVGQNTPSGSYALVAFTSPASGGPNERGQTTLYVNQTGASGVEDLQILTTTLSDGTLGVSYTQALQADGGLEP